jgi:F-type H+-transporting ATPase subunit b
VAKRFVTKFGLAVIALSLLTPVAGMSAQTAQAAPAEHHHHDAQPSGASSSEAGSPQAAVPEKNEEVRDENYEYTHSEMVTKLGRMIGLNAEQASTAFTIFNFLVMAVLVGWGLLKALPKTFRARTSNIQKQLVDARTATEEANARLNSVEARLSKLDEKIAGFRAQAKADSERDEQRMRTSVEDEKKKIVAAAEAEIQTATAVARREIQQYAADLAIEQAARKLIVTAETDRLIVESFAHRLGMGKEEQN